jgi:hypothetical protein
MTKRELIKLLKPYSPDIQIYVGGCHPKVYYQRANEGLPASINFEDENYYEIDPGATELTGD